jgi:undecaprenyl phosphate N,N'-diacetylbacillosamine 1-phosphate transferase
MLFAIIGIKIESKGPVLFEQARPGKNGEIFIVYKFRTMCVETSRNGRILTDMERITRVGSFLRKTSIDELPQIFNIIRGEMSFIGPRPLLVQYLKHYSMEEMRRHDVLPGISGLAQVNGRNAIGWEEKFKLDVWYVDHISILLDIKILVLTLKNVLKRKGINSSQENTMPFFSGSKEQAN